MSRPTDRFGIGSLSAYDELISPSVNQAQLAGYVDYLQSLQPQQQKSVQEPTAAQSLMTPTPTLEDEFKTRRATYAGILGDPEEQRSMTQAQMLFDIANTALAFSTAGSRPGMSPAERLAEAAVETKLFPTIAARTQAALEQKQKFDLAALQSAETSLAAKEKAAADLRKAVLTEDPDLKMITLPGQKPRPVNTKSTFGRNLLATAYATPGSKVENLGTYGKTEGSKSVSTYVSKVPITVGNRNVPANTQFQATAEEVLSLDPVTFTKYEKPSADTKYTSEQRVALQPLTIRGQTIQPGTAFQASDEELQNVSATSFRDFTEEDNKTKQYVPTKEITVGNQVFPAGQPIMLTDTQVIGLGDPSAVIGYEQASKQNNYTPKKEIEFQGRTYGPGDELALMPSQVSEIQKQFGLDALQQWDPATGSVQDNYLLSETFTLKDGTQLPAGQVVSLTRLQANELPKDTSEKLSGTPSMENWFDPKTNKTINVKNIGGTLFDMNQGGVKIDFTLPEYAGIVDVTETFQMGEFKLLQAQQGAAEEARELEQKLLGQNAANLVTSTPATNLPQNQSYTQRDRRLVYDAVEAAAKGVGPWAYLRRSFNEIVGGLSPVETEFFGDTTRANNLIRTINVLGRVAVANSPRFAEGEQARLEPLFPSPDQFFQNPQSAITRLVELKQYVEGEKLMNLQALSRESDPSLRRQMKQQNYAIDSLLRLLEGVPRMGVLSEEEEAALDAVRARQQ